jgi:hypothetical protein
METLLKILAFFVSSCAYGAATPSEIASELLAAPSIVNLDDSGADRLLAVFLRIAKCDSDTIPEGLRTYDSKVDARDDAQVTKAFFNNPVLMCVLFQFPRGPAKARPPSHEWWDRRDERQLNQEEEIEYCIPVEVIADGVGRLEYRLAGYEGAGPHKFSTVEVFDRCRANSPRRKIDFEKQPPRQMPASGTPAAGAPIATPSGKAGH